MTSERERLLKYYTSHCVKRRQQAVRPGNRYLASRRWEATVTALRALKRGRGSVRYLDVGCGNGTGLDLAVRALGTVDVAVGLDLLADAWARQCREASGRAVVCGDAARLPFDDGVFDVVSQYLLLTSIADLTVRHRMAQEMLRVTRPGGVIVSLDLRWPRWPPPWGGALGRRALRVIFGSDPIVSETCGLHPWLARMLAPWSPRACDLLARVPSLRLYRLALFQRPLRVERGTAAVCVRRTPDDRSGPRPG